MKKKNESHFEKAISTIKKEHLDIEFHRIKDLIFYAQHIE